MSKKILGIGIVAILIVMLVTLTGCGENKEEQNQNIQEQESSRTDLVTYNLSGTFMGIHTQDSMSSQIDITGTTIIWTAPGEEMTGTFTIEGNKLKATWSNGTTSEFTIENDTQLKGIEPFSDTGEVVVFNKK